MDGTLTRARVWRGIMDYYLQRRPKRATHLAFLAVHYPLYLVRRLGLISEGQFRYSWAGHLSWYFRGDTVEEGADLWDWMIGDYLPRYWRQDVLELLGRHQTDGDLIVLVSSSPRDLLQRVAQEIGADQVIGTAFEKHGGIYTGKYLSPVCVDEHKEEMTRAHLDKQLLQVEFSASYAYADSLADKPLLGMTGHPVATHPEPGLRKLAERNSWTIFPQSPQ